MASEPVSGRGESESHITLGLLDAVHDNAAVSQRTLARELGIALGLTNAYLKRCIRKGWIKVSQAPANRYAYYLTPTGFAEKSRLTANYLVRSLKFYREARNQFDDLLSDCERRGWRRIALYGVGELAEIALLCAMQYNVDIVGIVDREGTRRSFLHYTTVHRLAELGALDAVVLTELKRPQAAHEALASEFAADKVLAPPLLRVSRAPGPAPRSEAAS